MSYETKSIIISSRDSKEKDKEVLLYSIDKGKIYAKFKGVKNQKSKLKAGKELFTFGDFFIEESKAGSIVTGVNIIDSFQNIALDIDKYFEACSILDIVKNVPISEEDTSFFISTLKALKTLNYEKTQKNMVFFKFLTDFFENNGFNFDFSRCSSCGAKLIGKKYINPDVGEIVCPHCKQNTYIEIDESIVSSINILKNTKYEKLNSVKFTEVIGQNLISFLARNFEWRFGLKLKLFN